MIARESHLSWFAGKESEVLQRAEFLQALIEAESVLKTGLKIAQPNFTHYIIMHPLAGGLVCWNSV